VTDVRKGGSQVGVCVVRVERQTSHLLITVTTTPNIATGADRSVHVTSAGSVIALVDEFLTTFTTESTA
jgi:hypothetical protein